MEGFNQKNDSEKTRIKKQPPVNYGESDLKKSYLEKERVQARLIAPSFSTFNF
jgi:hypothetical protein